MDADAGDTETSKRLHQKTREVIETLDYPQYREKGNIEKVEPANTKKRQHPL